MKEVWKDIPGFVGMYQVSNFGRVKRLARNSIYGKCNAYNEVKRSIKEKILVQEISIRGYLRVGLCLNGKQKKYSVHRLVALAFLPNPNNLPDVNHKDENPLNNHLDNLEWCSLKYNRNYGTGKERSGKAESKPVIQCDLQGNEIQKFQSARKASETLGVCYKHISDCCLGRRNTHKGFIWKFA